MRARPEFSFDRPFMVSAPGGFTCNGRRYRSGDPLDWQQLGLDEAGIWDLWLMNQVDNVPPPTSNSAPKPATQPPPRQRK
jgi:hypothetical protein